MTYKDHYGLYHDKPTKNAEPSSHNGWIYTAYAKNLGLELPPYERLLLIKKAAMKDTQDGFWINRLPDVTDPVISHDEIVGMISLGVLDAEELEERNWSMTTVGFKDYSFMEQVKGLLSLRGQHRTYVHREPVKEAYPVVFGILPHLRYYAKALSGKPTSILEKIAFNLGVFLDLVQPSAWSSTHNLTTLMLEDLGSWFWIRFYNKKKNYYDYFKEGHVFREEFE